MKVKMVKSDVHHPLQPLVTDKEGVLRFKPNAIVEKLRALCKERLGYDMNEIAMEQFDPEDRRQFAQLIGYSLSGYGELSYVSSLDFEAANFVKLEGVTDTDVRLALVEQELEALKKALREPMARLFEIHPDDLK